MEESITNIQSIYEGRIVKLALHTVRLPDGSEGMREIITHPGAVALVALDDDDHVLLVRQFRSAIRQITLEIPAGTLHPAKTRWNVLSANCAKKRAIVPGRLRQLAGFMPRRVTPLNTFTCFTRLSWNMRR